MSASVAFFEEIGISPIFPAMRSFLLQPYPFSENAGRKLAVCAGIGLFVALFLAIFQPFGIDRLPGQLRWLHPFYFGAVTFLVAGFSQTVVPFLLPGVFKESRWRSWKEIVYLLVNTFCIGGANLLLMLKLYPQNFSLQGFWNVQIITLQVGIFPILFVVFFKQLRLYRQYAAEAKTVTEDMEQTPSEADLSSHAETQPAPQPAILIKGDGAKEELALQPQHLFFLASADNYVRVQFKDDEIVQARLIRSTLKKMEEQLGGYPEFFRCHRMYMVNLQLVQSVSGNAQGLKLHLTATDESIPVSRSLTSEVKNRLHQLSHSPQNS